jgi:hypothetical protein
VRLGLFLEGKSWTLLVILDFFCFCVYTAREHESLCVAICLQCYLCLHCGLKFGGDYVEGIPHFKCNTDG